MASELQQLLDEAAGLMGWDCWPVPSVTANIDGILGAFEEALPGWRFQLKPRGDGQFIWMLAMGTPGYDSKVVSVACTGHTVAAWRLDLARLLVAALRAQKGATNGK